MNKFHTHWDKLRIFHQVALVGSFNGAADVLNISQPALSRTINILEDYLEFHLFERLPRGLRLTHQGEIIFQMTKKIVGELEKTQVQLEEDESEPVGSIIIGAPSGIAASHLPSILPEFLRQYPRIQISICGGDTLPNLHNGEADAIISPYIKDDDNLIQTHLTTFRMKLYASREYVQEHGQPKTLEDLDHHRLLAYGDHKQCHPFSLANWHLGAGLRKGQIRRPFLILNTSAGLVNMATRGVGIISFSTDHPGLEGSNLVNLLPEMMSPPLKGYFVYTNRTKKLRRMKLLESFLLQAFSQNLNDIKLAS